ncbi:MAG TPA: hypothetical protein VIM84_13790, partial [Gemmatimonadales bacterium]
MHRSLMLSGLLVLSAGCAASGGSSDSATGAAQVRVRPGLEVVLSDSLRLLTHRRIGLVTNQSGIDAGGRRGLDRMLAAGLDVTAVFA